MATIGIASMSAGCVSTLRDPDRLFPIAAETGGIRFSQEELIKQYSAALANGAFDHAKALRNEIVSQRMYAIDLNYSEYELGLTRERQTVGFATLTTAEGLSTAATLVTPTATKTILSGLTTAVVATKGHYESEILLAQTMRTIQKQMRASRSRVAEHISAQMGHNIVDYPLAAALSDVEDYYRAGTLTTGILDTSTTVGEQERKAEERRQEIARLPAAARSAAVLSNSTTPIPAPVRVPVLNREGLGFAEQRLFPVEIRRFERLVCLQQRTGRFTASLRTALIERLGPRKDPSAAGEITTRDVNLLTREFRAIPADHPC